MSDFISMIEEALRFAKGKDDDFFNKQFAIITVNKGDINKYKVEGRTAGIWSHACKHLSEIDQEFVDNIIQQVKRTLIDYVDQDNHPKAYELNYFNNQGTKEEGDPLAMVKKASKASIINFLDLVNDKVQLHDKLSPIEEKMVKFLETLGQRYGAYIEAMMEKAEDIDRLTGVDAKYKAFSSGRIISFNIIGLLGNDRPMKVYLDLVHDFIIIKTGEFVNTMYKVNYKGSGRKALLRAFNYKVMKNARFANVDTYRAFSDLLDL